VQSPAEEVANSVTHGLGAALGLAALVALVLLAARHGDAWRIVSLSVYGTTLFLLYLASTLYHALPGVRVKRVLRVLDHVSIYLLIAGTYTPITLVPLRGPWGFSLFGVIWGLAAAGIVARLAWPGRHGLAVALYVAMGWAIVVAVEPMLRLVPPGLVAWLLAGGAFYTLGIAFYVRTRMRFHHAVWHLFVLAGSVCHFVGMLLYVAGPAPGPPPVPPLP